MKNLTIIIPFKEISDSACESKLEKAITSCGDNRVILVVPEGDFSKTFAENVSVLKVADTNCSTPAAFINAGVNACKSDWFSILQFDDEFKGFWFDEAEKYIKAFPTNSVFMPLTEAVNEEGKILGYQNEIAWASSFVNELGELPFDALKDYHLFSPWGAVINRGNFLKDGALKPSIKASFMYEFLLRSANEGHSVYVIPKAGYKHLLGRENGYNSTVTNGMDRDELEWWFDLAKKECYFKNDRNKTYED